MTTRFRWATALLFLALALVFFGQDPTEARHRPWRGPHVTEDGWYYWHWLRSAAFDGDLDLSNDYREFGNWYGFGSTPTGKPHNPFGIGPALLWAPGFALGHAVARLGAPAVVANGYSAPEQAGALATSFLASLGAFLFGFALCRRFTGERTAWLATALAYLGSPLVWYALYSPAMPHAFEACFGAAFLWSALPLRERRIPDALALGLITGGMLLVRPQLVVLLALPVVEAARAIQLRRKLAPPLLALGLVVLVALAVNTPQLWVWKSVYGRWLLIPQGPGFLRFDASLWSETLFSSRNGLFTSTPLLWLTLPGLVVLTHRERSLGGVLVGAFALQVFVNGAVWDWWGGGAFGGRRYLASFPIWALSIAALADAFAAPGRLVRARVGLAALVTSGLLWLQWRLVRAHHSHSFSWEASVPFPERMRVASAGSWPLNPFAFPANAWFALRHGVPLAQYDFAVGPYLLDERLPTTNPLLPRKRAEGVDLSRPESRGFLGRGFSRAACGAALEQPAGELFVPLNRPGALTLEVEVEVEGTWSFNGRTLGPGTRWRIDAASVERGLNVLRVESAGDRRGCVRRLQLTEGTEWPPPWATVYERSP